MSRFEASFLLVVEKRLMPGASLVITPSPTVVPSSTVSVAPTMSVSPITAPPSPDDKRKEAKIGDRENYEFVDYDYFKEKMKGIYLIVLADRPLIYEEAGSNRFYLVWR